MTSLPVSFHIVRQLSASCRFDGTEVGKGPVGMELGNGCCCGISKFSMCRREMTGLVQNCPI